MKSIIRNLKIQKERQLSYKEALIIALKLGYVKRINYSIDEIANFLKLSLDEVETIISKSYNIHYGDILRVFGCENYKDLIRKIVKFLFLRDINGVAYTPLEVSEFLKISKFDLDCYHEELVGTSLNRQL